jgi:hypothetical protein
MQTISQNVSQSTNQQRMGARQRGPIRQLATEEEGEEEDDSDDDENGGEGEEEDDPDNDEIGGEQEEDEDLWLARDVLRASDKFKDHRMRQVLQGAANDIRRAYPDDLTTSDIQDYLKDVVEDAQLRADYPIEVYTKIYVNKTLARRKNLPDTTRDNFDLLDIEDKLAQDLDILGNGEPISILQRTAFVHAATRKTAQKVHDLDDFKLIEAGRILKMMEATREQHLQSKIALTIEIRTSITVPTRKPQTPQTQGTRSGRRSLFSSAVFSSSCSGEEEKSRTLVLEAQQAVRLDKIQLASDFERQLADKLVCRDKDCTNQDNFYWSDLVNPKQHYAVTAPQHKSWAQAISVTDRNIASCALNSRIANKASNLILVPLSRLAEWLKLFTPLAAAPGQCRHRRIIRLTCTRL